MNMKSSLGFHTLKIFLPLRAGESISLLSDFFQYSHDTSRIIIDRVYREDGRTKTEAIKIEGDGVFHLPLETIITYRQDIGIKWRIISKRNNPNFNSYTVEAIINPKILSGINDYLTAATLDDMEVAISNFNLEAKKISPLLQDFSCYKLSRIDYCINFSLKELVPECTPEQMMSLIRRSNIPPSYTEWMEYDEVAHRMKSRPSSFYLMNRSVHINCYSKYLQLVDQSKKNIDKGYPPIPQETLDRAWDVIRFEVQSYYPKTYSLAKQAERAGNHSPNKFENLLDRVECIDQISEYFNKTIGSGHWYTLPMATKIIENQNFNRQKERRLIDALQFVNQCRSVAKAIECYQGRQQETFRKTLRDISSLGVNPVTIPKEWGIKYIPNLLYAYFDKVDSEKLKEDLERFQLECLYENVKKYGLKSS